MLDLARKGKGSSILTGSTSNVLVQMFETLLVLVHVKEIDVLLRADEHAFVGDALLLTAFYSMPTEMNRKSVCLVF